LGKPVRPLEEREGDFWLTIDQFEHCLDVVTRIAGDHSREVHITFDDGNRSDLEIALPRLRNRGLIGTFFVLADYIGRPGFLTASDILDLRRSGMAVGTHGCRHVDWQCIPDSELDRELVASRAIIADILGEPVNEIAIPFGSYSPHVLRRLSMAAYAAIYTSDGGSYRSNSWLRPRTCMRADFTRDDISRILTSDAGFHATILQEARLLKRRIVPTALGSPGSVELIG
jgi:peptidoglycan/xylan/chitin deacetylase (PgdA/CDA1 family)